MRWPAFAVLDCQVPKGLTQPLLRTGRVRLQKEGQSGTRSGWRDIRQATVCLLENLESPISQNSIKRPPSCFIYSVLLAAHTPMDHAEAPSATLLDRPLQGRHIIVATSSPLTSPLVVGPLQHPFCHGRAVCARGERKKARRHRGPVAQHQSVHDLILYSATTSHIGSKVNAIPAGGVGGTLGVFSRPPPVSHRAECLGWLLLLVSTLAVEDE